MSFLDELRKKLKELGWLVVLQLLRWLLERLTDDEKKED